MKTQPLFRILLVFSILFVTLAVTSPTFADTKDHWIWDTEAIYTIDALDPDNPCGFDIFVHEYGILRGNAWFDDSGQYLKEFAIFGNLKIDWSANGKTVKLQIQGPIHYVDYQYTNDNIIVTAKYMGTNVLVTIPHYGKVYGGGGQLLEIITFDKNWNYISSTIDNIAGNINFDDISPVCTYLGP